MTDLPPHTHILLNRIADLPRRGERTEEGALNLAQLDMIIADTRDALGQPQTRPDYDADEDAPPAPERRRARTDTPPPHDSATRELIVRQYAERILHNPTRAQLEQAIAAICREWDRDHQATHEQSYSDGADGVMA